MAINKFTNLKYKPLTSFDSSDNKTPVEFRYISNNEGIAMIVMKVSAFKK